MTADPLIDLATLAASVTGAAPPTLLPGVRRRLGGPPRSGVNAASTVLALHRAGRTDAALYVGSWSRWVTDPGRPVAAGQQP